MRAALSPSQQISIEGRPNLSKSQGFNLALRAIMELGIVLAFAYWGFQTGDSTGTKILLAVGVPIVGFGFWGIVDFHQAGRLSEPLRLVEELIISGLAAAALYIAGQQTLGLALGLISIVYHVLMYWSGERLLKHQSFD